MNKDVEEDVWRCRIERGKKRQNFCSESHYSRKSSVRAQFSISFSLDSSGCSLSCRIKDHIQRFKFVDIRFISCCCNRNTLRSIISHFTQSVKQPKQVKSKLFFFHSSSSASAGAAVADVWNTNGKRTIFLIALHWQVKITDETAWKKNISHYATGHKYVCSALFSPINSLFCPCNLCNFIYRLLHNVNIVKAPFIYCIELDVFYLSLTHWLTTSFTGCLPF